MQGVGPFAQWSDERSRRDGDDDLALVERVRRRCRSIDVRAEPLRPLAHHPAAPIPVRVSAGIAVYPHDTANRHELVSRADTALYADKRNGQARIVRSAQNEDAQRRA